VCSQAIEGIGSLSNYGDDRRSTRDQRTNWAQAEAVGEAEERNLQGRHCTGRLRGFGPESVSSQVIASC
jgi:hypothetical protein